MLERSSNISFQRSFTTASDLRSAKTYLTLWFTQGQLVLLGDQESDVVVAVLDAEVVRGGCLEGGAVVHLDPVLSELGQVSRVYLVAFLASPDQNVVYKIRGRKIGKSIGVRRTYLVWA